MAQLSVQAVSIANEEIGARDLVEHEGEIFSAHGGLLVHQVVFTHGVLDHFLNKSALFAVVEGGWVIAFELKGALALKGGAQVLRQVAHAPLNHVEHLFGEGANGATQLTSVRDHVGGFTRVDHGDRDHACINGFFIACDDGLKGLHELASDEDWVNTVVRERSV